MPYDGKTSRGGLMVAITKAADDDKMRKRARPGMDGIALLIKSKKPAEMERGEASAMLEELAQASIKAHEEKDASAIATIWRHAHDVLCEMQSAHMEPEEAED